MTKYSPDFDAAFERLLGHEGGYTTDPNDRGNWTGGQIGRGELRGTHWGISAMSYPGEDIQHLSQARAKELYHRDFWGPAGCDSVPPGLRFDLFDTAVNSGVRQAVRLLQRACGETDDGILGPRTLQAVQSMPAPRLVARYNGHRLQLMTELATWSTYGRGWARRVAHNLQAA